MDNENTIYFTNYYKAKEYAQKHNLIECEYGDTGYMWNDEPISYCAYNLSGNRFDDWTIMVYYTWERVLNEKNGHKWNSLKPSYKTDESFSKTIQYNYGIIL